MSLIGATDFIVLIYLNLLGFVSYRKRNFLRSHILGIKTHISLTALIVIYFLSLSGFDFICGTYLNMFALVKFKGDPKFYVSHLKHIKIENERILIKWKTTYYEGEVIYKNHDRQLLDSLKNNYNGGLPRIIINTCYSQMDSNFHDDESLQVSSINVENEEDYFDDSDADPDFNPENYLKKARKPIKGYSSNVKESIRYFREIDKHVNQINKTSDTDDHYDEGPLNQRIQISDGKKKLHCCYFCKQLFTHLPRHLERKHQEEENVKKFSLLPKGCLERKEIIDIIRKKGNFIYNTRSQYNKGDLITSRKATVKKKKEDYIPCSVCYGFYSKLSIRKHFLRCSKESNKGSRKVQVMGRQILCQLSKKANTTVRNKIFPVLREDEVTKCIRYDELVIIYANKMSLKYRSPHHFPMIRSRIRLLGRLLLELKKKNNFVTDLSSIYKPENYDSIVDSINIVAKLDVDQQKYNSPSTAFAAGTLLKKCGNIYISELIKLKNSQKKQEVEDFLKLIEVDYGISVNRTVQENQQEIQRQKKIMLPSMDDIKKLHNYLRINLKKYHRLLKEKSCIEYYKELASYTLISVQIFNRRRAGEIERIKISDFHSYQTIDENCDKDIFASLSADAQIASKNYARMVIRGKKGRSVPVLLHNEHINSIKVIIASRCKVGVPNTNQYVFGIPGNNEENFLRACVLLREYSVKCGAKRPETLRGTSLRKHIATQAQLLNLSENEVSDLANFMGHHEKIHREHYRLPIVARDITRMSKLLEIAQTGGDDSDDEQILQSPINCEPISNISMNSHDSSCKKRSTSPFGSVRRTSWNDGEKLEAKKILGEYINNNTLPSLDTCQQVLTVCPILNKRTAMQLKLWVHNQIKKKENTNIVKENEKPDNKKKICRTHWSSPERAIALKVFKKYIEDGVLPSIQICREISKNNDEFQKRTAIQLKLWVHNQIKKKKSKEKNYQDS